MIKKLGTHKSYIATWLSYPDNKPYHRAKYLVKRKDGKIHQEMYNGTAWAYNNKVIIEWLEFIPQNVLVDEYDNTKLFDRIDFNALGSEQLNRVLICIGLTGEVNFYTFNEWWAIRSKDVSNPQIFSNMDVINDLYDDESEINYANTKLIWIEGNRHLDIEFVD